MTIEDNIGCRNEGETCVVCGKGLRPGEMLATLHQDGSKLPICCPLCLEAYQQDPKPYLERLARRTLLRELRKSEDAPPGRRQQRKTSEGLTRFRRKHWQEYWNSCNI